MGNTEREEVLSKARAAKDVAPVVAQLSTPRKNEILQRAAENLIAHTDDILAANQQDIEAGRERGMSDPLIDRLTLDAARVEGIADGLRQVAGLQDPVGEILQGRTMDNGIQMKQVRVPLGVMGMVYEGPDPRKVDTSGVSYAALVSVAEVSASKTSGATRLHQECRRRVL